MMWVLRRDDDYPTCWQQVALVTGGEFPDVLSQFIELHFLIPPALHRAAAAAVRTDSGLLGRKKEHIWIWIISAGAVE